MNYDVSTQRKARETLEGLISDMVSSISAGRLPFWTLPRKCWTNLDQASGHIASKGGDEERSGVNPLLTVGLLKFVRLAVVICRCYARLNDPSVRANLTKRGFYYQYPALFCYKQAIADAIIDEVSAMTKLPRLALGVCATPKGLIAAPGVKLISAADQDVVELSSRRSIEITDALSLSQIIDNEAEFILVVEKEATFENMLGSGFVETWPCILITGKGYPDLATRRLTKSLLDRLKLPIFGLFDGDPHGIHIMCSYKFGTLARMHENESLTVSEMQWLGMKSSDADVYQVPQEAKLALSDFDRKKINDLMKNPFVEMCDELNDELTCLRSSGWKMEIQALDLINPEFLCVNYLPHKFVTFGYNFRKYPLAAQEITLARNDDI